MIRRSSRLLLEILAAVLAGFIVLAGLAAWRLSQDEPVRLTFLTPYIVEALTPADGSFKVAIDDTVLTWGGWARTIDLRATGLHVQDANGRTVAAIPALSLTLSVRALLLHRLVAPTAIEIFQPHIFVVREADGHFRFVHSAPDDPSQAGEETSPVLTRLLQTLLATPDPSLPTGYLTRASVTDGQVTFIDRRAGVTWQAPAANIVLGRDAQGIVGQFDLTVAKLGDPARLNAVAVYDAQKQRLLLTANVAGVHAGALAAIDPVLGRFSGADVTLSGRLTSSMDLDGRIGSTTFDLAGGQGTLTMPSTFEAPLPIRYHGFVEGDDVGHGVVDVVVTDGFTGNIALKTAEGTAKQIGEYLRAAMGRSLLARLGAVLAQGAFRALKEKLDPRQLNGGIFLGLNGIVVKSHGGTDATGFACAIDLAYDMASNGVVERLASEVARFHAKLELEGAA